MRVCRSTRSNGTLRSSLDPADQMLRQIHKIVYISQLPPATEKDHARRCVNKYKKLLFAADSPLNLRDEMKKVSHSYSSSLSPFLPSDRSPFVARPSIVDCG